METLISQMDYLSFLSSASFIRPVFPRFYFWVELFMHQTVLKLEVK